MLFLNLLNLIAYLSSAGLCESIFDEFYFYNDNFTFFLGFASPSSCTQLVYEKLDNDLSLLLLL